MSNLSPFEVVIQILKDGTPKIARDVAKLARPLGLDWTREHANSALYKMLRNSLVVKIETEKAPLWTLPEFADEYRPVSKANNLNIIPRKAKPIPLVLEKQTTLRIQGIDIHFAFDNELSPNEAYISGDWLNDKIFVTVNGNHPFFQSFIDTDEKKKLFIALAAEEVFVQWKVAKQTSRITPAQLLEIRDAAMRDIVHNL